MKKKSSNAMFNKLVNNKITLYIVAIIAFITLIGNIMNSEVSAIFLFFLAGGVAYSFTKNMTIVLGSSIISTSVASMLSSYFVYKEGLEGLEDISDPSNNNISSNKKGSSKKVLPMKKVSADENIPSKTSNSDNAEALTQLSPALFNNIPNKDQMQKQLGKATEMEQAYDNLEKIMGKDNIQSITTDTKDLIKQQNELIKQLKTMTPALNEAMSSIGNLDLSKLTNMFSSATKTLSDLKTE
jgi:hypothetical protein